jgi:hypothetical protein
MFMMMQRVKRASSNAQQQAEHEINDERRDFHGNASMRDARERLVFSA